MLLPVNVEFDFPFLPPLDKNNIPPIMVVVGCIFIKKMKLVFIPENGPEKWLVIVLLFAPLLTTVTNMSPIFNGDIWIPGLTFYDSISATIKSYLQILPFILGLQIIKNYDDQLLLFKLLVIAGLLYSLPMLFEIRMSPQLHSWTYGFFPHSFEQQIRYGGYRPVVYMGHGLLVAMFTSLCLGAAALLWKNKIRIYGISPFIIVCYLIVLLILCKSIGAILLGLLLLIAILLPKHIITVLGKVIVCIVIFYPLLLILEIFPHQEIIDFVMGYDFDRAYSLEHRFVTENILIQHIKENILFGLGGWGRNRLWDSITDGYWIILLSMHGFVGLCAIFGLVVLAIWSGLKDRYYLVNRNEQNLLIAHAFLAVIILVDQIPNASLEAYSWFLLGTLLGRVRSIQTENIQLVEESLNPKQEDKIMTDTVHSCISNEKEKSI